MKKRLLGLILACGFATVCSTPVWAEANGDAMSMKDNYALWNESRLDDNGLFQSFADKANASHYFISTNITAAEQNAWIQDYNSTDMLDNQKRLTLYLNLPCENYAVFFTKSDAENDAAVQIFKKHFSRNNLNYEMYSDLKKEFDGSIQRIQYATDQSFFILCDEMDNGNPEKTTATLDAVYHDLAAENLITAFYYPDQVYYQKALSIPYLTGYIYHPGQEENVFEPEQVQNYLDTNGITCTIQEEQRQNAVMYYVVPNESMDFWQHFELAVLLYHELGIVPQTTENLYDSRLSPMGAFDPALNKQMLALGKNALQITGDANCDGSIDVSDAVLIARFAAEDREATMTDQGRQNADVTHDGNVDAQDTTKILQYIAKQIRLEDLAK